MQKRPYSREERFHAMEKELLKPLKPEPYDVISIVCNMLYHFFANAHK